MDIGRSFSYMFEDEDWIKKILIGGVISIIPIVNFAAFGYVVQVIRNVRDGRALPLPEWDRFGEYFMSGLWIFLIYLIYLIPIYIVACVQGVIPAVMENAGAGGDMAGALGVVSVCLSCIVGLWGFLVGILFPAVMVRFAETGKFSAGFEFGELFGIIRANVGSYVIVLLLCWVATGIIAPLGLIACIVGIIFTTMYAYLIAGHLIGQLAAQIRQGGVASV